MYILFIKCSDVEPPAFRDCPTSPRTLILSEPTAVPEFIQLPTVSDNSGIHPSVTFEPADFKLPYKFVQVRCMKCFYVLSGTDNLYELVILQHGTHTPVKVSII